MLLLSPATVSAGWFGGVFVRHEFGDAVEINIKVRILMDDLGKRKF